ncbi:MAG: SDR family NAD(P)-dependent oxidoreductase [Verrucomicrobiota bacterium]
MPEPRRLRLFLTGASAGIGLAIAQRLIQEGHEVWGTARDLTRLPTFSGFHPVRMDLLDNESIREGFAAALAEAVCFDVIINNAGVGVFGPTEDIPAELVHSQYQVLVFAPLEIIRLALPEMRKQGSGKIVNVTSLAAEFPIPFMSSYSAAKAALKVQTTCLRLELSDTPIQVIEVVPGDINTKFHGATVRVGVSSARSESVWELQKREMESAPRADVVADAVSQILAQPNPHPVRTVGKFDQALLAPLLKRIVPVSWLEWGMRRYFGF